MKSVVCKSFRVAVSAFLACLIVLNEAAFSQDLLLPTTKAITNIESITIRLDLPNDLVGTAFFISPCGIALTHIKVLDLYDKGEIIFDDNTKSSFKLMYSNSDLEYALILIVDGKDVRSIPRVLVRDTASMRETEILISRICIKGGALYDLIGSVAFLSPNAGCDEMVVQMPKSTGGGGSPFLDIDGNLVGYLRGTVNLGTFSLPMVTPYNEVLRSLERESKYANAINTVLEGVEIDASTLVVNNVGVNGSVIKRGDKVISVDQVRVESLHELRMACWASHSRGRRLIALGVSNESGERTYEISIH